MPPPLTTRSPYQKPGWVVGPELPDDAESGRELEERGGGGALQQVQADDVEPESAPRRRETCEVIEQAGVLLLGEIPRQPFDDEYGPCRMIEPASG
jgi:hypothetical protein